jgi:molecular chaperone GrpE
MEQTMKKEQKQSTPAATDTESIEQAASDAELAALDAPDNIDSCLEIIKALEKEKNELKESYLRAAADMENLRKRTAIELEKTSRFAITKFAKDLLSVADNLSRALDTLNKEENQTHSEAIKNLIAGIELTQKELTSAFEKNGIHKQESKGKIFDPQKDKVVQEREDKSVPAGTVLEEWQPAYMIGDRILREAVVVVAKN